MALFSRRRTPPAQPDPLEAPPTFEEPNQAEWDWMAGHLAFAHDMSVDLDDAIAIGQFYDTLHSQWRDSARETRNDPNTYINVLGTTFGEHLVRQTPMRWVVATDPNGTELALHDATTGLLVYPANLVAKRWVADEPGSFIPMVCDEIARRTTS